jgi:hypothetical protein
VGGLTRGQAVALSGGLTTIGLYRLGDLAIAVDDCGALGECDRLARLALFLRGVRRRSEITVQPVVGPDIQYQP